MRDWLFCGFVGFLPEHSVLFIWDQLAMFGGSGRDDCQVLLPHIAAIVLQVPFLSVRSSLSLPALSRLSLSLSLSLFP